MGKKNVRKIEDGKNKIKPKGSSLGFNIILGVIFLLIDLILILNYANIKVNNADMEILDQLIKLGSVFGTKESFQIGSMLSNNEVMNIFWTTQKNLLLVYIIIAMILIVKLLEPKQDFKGIEHGSADWATKEDKKRFSDSKNSIVLADELYLSLKDEEADNLNELVIGGSGAGKSWRKIKPDIIQMIGSYVVTDPKGELYRDTAKVLKKNGYKVKVLNLMQPTFSDGYNPFNYVNPNDDTDVMALVDCFMKNTSDDKKSGGDQFWDDSTKALLTAIFFYLVREENEEKCFQRVYDLVNNFVVDEETGEIDENKSELERIFKRIEQEDSSHPGLQAYKTFKLASGKTAKSILISVAVRLRIWTTKDICTLTYKDDMDLENVGTEKTAIFLITPDTHDTYKIIASMFYTQLFKVLFYEADFKHNGRLPYLVSCELDEFANIGEIPNFEKYIATMRSRNVRVAIVLQALSQLEKLYKDSWEIILGCCYVVNYLGTTDSKTQKFVSERLGKTTVLVKNRGESKSSKSYSVNDNGNYMARDLMSVDEVNKLDKANSIVLIRGLSPFYCNKFLTQHHPLIKDVGSQFERDFHNNTDIHKAYEEKARKNSEEFENRKLEKVKIQKEFDSLTEKDFEEDEVRKFFEENRKM